MFVKYRLQKFTLYIFEKQTSEMCTVDPDFYFFLFLEVIISDESRQKCL